MSHNGFLKWIIWNTVETTKEKEKKSVEFQNLQDWLESEN